MPSNLIENTKENKRLIKRIFSHYKIIITNHAIDRLYDRCGFLSNIDIDILAEKLSQSLYMKVNHYGVLKVFTKKYRRKDGFICYTHLFVIDGIHFIVAYEPDTEHYIILTVILSRKRGKAR